MPYKYYILEQEIHKMDVTTIITIILAITGWIVIVKIAKKNSERAEIKSLVARAIDILIELEKEAIDAWQIPSVEATDDDNAYVISSVASRCKWLMCYINFLNYYLDINIHIHKHIKFICTENYENNVKLNPQQRKYRILEIHKVILYSKYDLERAFLQKYHKKLKRGLDNPGDNHMKW